MRADDGRIVLSFDADFEAYQNSVVSFPIPGLDYWDDLNEARETMPVYKYAFIYAVCLIVFLVMDFIWLGWVAQPFYHEQLGELLSPKVVWPAAIAFYIMYIIGLIIFCVAQALQRQSWRHALLVGALYGFFTYATFEFTNFALIRDWPFGLVPVDIAWGVILCAVVSCAGYLTGRWLENSS